MAGQAAQRHRTWRQWRRWPWVVALPLAIVLLPPQVSRFTCGDLTPVPQPQVADAVNGWVALKPLVAGIEGQPPLDLYAGVAEGRMAAATRAWVKQNTALLPELDAALAKTAWSWPRPTSFAQDMSELSGFRQAVRLLCAAAMLDAEDGRTGPATRRLTHLLRASDGLLICEASTVQYLVTCATEAMICRSIQRAAAAKPIDREWSAWQPLDDLLRANPDRAVALEGAFRGEYALFRATIAGSAEPAAEETGIPVGLPPCWFWDPWQMQSAHRANLDRIAAEAAKPRPERDLDSIRALAAERPAPFTYNSVGAMVSRMTLAPMLKVLDKADLLTAHRRLTTTTLALRRAFDRQGKLPATLDSLVKDGLLDAVPADPFDAQPLRYDPARRLLWSIGSDDVDQHGRQREGTKGDADEVVPLGFR